MKINTRNTNYNQLLYQAATDYLKRNNIPLTKSEFNGASWYTINNLRNRKTMKVTYTIKAIAAAAGVELVDEDVELQIINLTLDGFEVDGKYYPPSGKQLKVIRDSYKLYDNNIIVISIDIEGLPDPIDGVMYVVDSYVQERFSMRGDLLSLSRCDRGTYYFRAYDVNIKN